MQQEAFVQSYVMDDDILVVKLHGKLDVTTTPAFTEEVNKHFVAGNHKVIVDCAHLGYLSSLGVGALMSMQTKLRKQGGEVKLAAIQGPVAQVLKVVHLDKVMGIYGDIEFAREAFHKQAG